MYLAIFIYFLPLAILIFIYIEILKYGKRKVTIVSIRQCVIEQKRRRRELQLIQRVVILVFILFITGFPYIFLFLLVNISRLPLPLYGHRISFMFIDFGQGTIMLLTMITTDYLRK